MVKIINDTLPLMMKQVNHREAEVAKKNNIPLFKGRLYKVIDDYGTEVHISDNTVVLGGAVTALEHLFGVTPNYKPQTLNSIYGVNAGWEYDEMQTYVKLFGCGIGGSELTFGNVIDPSFKQKDLIQPIPFLITDTPQLDSTVPDKYYFRVPLTYNTGTVDEPIEATKYAWYLKEFEKDVEIKSLWKNSTDTNADGEEILDDISSSTKTNLIESFGECTIKIDKIDLKDYFEDEDVGTNVGFKFARYNTIGLYTGQKVFIESEDRWDYVNVRLFSAVTFNNVSTAEEKEETYIYRIFGSI